MDRRLNDKSKICDSCGVVHLGRHPEKCMCRACKKKKGRSKSIRENDNLEVASEG